MKMKQLLAIVFCFSTALVAANAFVASRKTKRLSLSRLKQQSGDIFGQQVRLCTDLFKCIGQLHIDSVSGGQKRSVDYQLLRMYGMQLEQYRLQLDNLIEPVICKKVFAFEHDETLQALLGNLTIALAEIQQRLIQTIQELLEDESKVFCKKNLRALPRVISMVGGYTQHFRALHDQLVLLKK